MSDERIEANADPGRFFPKTFLIRGIDFWCKDFDEMRNAYTKIDSRNMG